MIHLQCPFKKVLFCLNQPGLLVSFDDHLQNLYADGDDRQRRKNWWYGRELQKGIWRRQEGYDPNMYSSVQSLSRVRLFATPWTAACQASQSITNSQSLLKHMSIESVMPSNYLFCRPLLLLPSVFPSIRVFSNGSVLHIRWPKFQLWSFSFSISPSNEYSGLDRKSVV